jgi:hypothetical protein
LKHVTLSLEFDLRVVTIAVELTANWGPQNYERFESVKVASSGVTPTNLRVDSKFTTGKMPQNSPTFALLIACAGVP